MRQRIRVARVSAVVAAVAALVIGLAVSLSPASSATPRNGEPQTPASAAAGPDLTSHAFFTAMLKRMHLPVTAANLNALYSVEHMEGDNDRYNPLNVVQPQPGSSAYNGAGVQRYASFASGLDGTVILFSNPHWTGVRNALVPGTSMSGVLSAFAGAYTWAGGINFPANQGIWDAEAVRDVGGPYADPLLAAQRATREQAGVQAQITTYTAKINAADADSQAAHSDFLAQQQRNRSAAATAAAQRKLGNADANVAAADHNTVMATIISRYINGGPPGTLQLLVSSSPTAYLDQASMQQYVLASEEKVFKRYEAEQARANGELAKAKAAEAIVTSTQQAMDRDRSSWQAADARAVQARKELTAILRAAQRNSIIAPLATAELARIASAARD